MSRQKVALFYLNNVVQREISPRATREILDWVDRYSTELFGFDITEKWGRINRYSQKVDSDSPVVMPRELKSLRTILKSQTIPDIRVRGQDSTLDAIMDCFELPEKYRNLLAFAVQMNCDSTLRSLWCEVSDCPRDFINKNSIHELSIFCKTSPIFLEQMLDVCSPLFRCGIFVLDLDGEVSFTRPMQRVFVGGKIRNVDDVRFHLLSNPMRAKLSIADFDYIREDVKYMQKILRNAMHKRMPGINILLYGAPGVGKTEFATALAQELNAKIYEMGGDTGRQSKGSSLHELTIAQRLLANDKSAIMLMDEVEDVFRYNFKDSEAPSKLSLNRTLEVNKRPVIWIANSTEFIDSAHLRRFTYCFKMPQPDVAQRIQIWRGINRDFRNKLSDADITHYAGKYNVSPAVIKTAIQNFVLTGQRASIDKTIENLQIALTGRAPKMSKFDATAFNPDILNTELDLINLADKLQQGGNKEFSLCLYGAAGTGKSMYARYLANRLGIPVVEKKVSDLRAKYVGETEQNIAAAFAEAKKAGALLIFDEADSLLTSREKVSASHEVGFVNEMLTQMEHADFPFVCTTNLMANIDKAALRRFTFKVKYDYMTTAQVAIAFKHFFGVSVQASQLKDLTSLTPGDFAVVQKKVKILNVTDANEIIDMLRQEISAKGIVVKEKIGFGL